MSNEEQLRAKTLALFHSLLSTWANELRGEVSGIQDGLISQLDSIQSRMAKYEENIDEGKILAFVQELGDVSVGGGGGGGESRLPQVRASMAQLENGHTLQEVLNTLVQEISQFAPRIALFVIKGGNCIGWNGLGFDQSPGFSNDALKRISVPANADTVFRAVMQSRQRFFGESSAHRDNAHLLSRIGTVLPTNIFAMPLILRDKVGAVIYADSGDSREPLGDVEAIEILVLYASRLLDLMNAAKSAGRATGDFQSDRMTALKEPVTPPPGPLAPPAPPVAPAPASGEDSGTVMLNVRDIEAHALSQGAAPSAPASAPPSLDSMDPETRKQHEDAKRFARLLISEIKLYNEAKVQQGRQDRSIYKMLRDDIERSRQLYSERVSADIRGATKYFDEELIRILGDGDAGAFGQHPN
jgi:hypothetical protein